MIKEQIFQLKASAYQLTSAKAATHDEALAQAMQLYLWFIAETDEFEKLKAQAEATADSTAV